MRLPNTYRVCQQQNWDGHIAMQALTVPEAAEIGLGEADREMRGLAVVAQVESIVMRLDPF